MSQKTAKFIGGPLGGPLDGRETWADSEGLCIQVGADQWACYYRRPWDECVFPYDGNYHFYKTVTGDQLRQVT